MTVLWNFTTVIDNRLGYTAVPADINIRQQHGVADFGIEFILTFENSNGVADC